MLFAHTHTPNQPSYARSRCTPLNRVMPSATCDAADVGKSQAALNAADEAAFVALAADPVVASGRPAYQALDTGLWYSATGVRVEARPDALAAFAASDDVVTTRCPCVATACRIATLIRRVKVDKDSVGGVLTCVVTGVPVGLGEPAFDKLGARLAAAMMSLPAAKGFELGSGFGGCRMRGSAHNDPFLPRSPSASSAPPPPPAAPAAVASAAAGAVLSCVGSSAGAGCGTLGDACSGAGAPVGAGSGTGTGSGAGCRLPLLRTATNFSGGTLGGISNGANIVFRVGIKPVSTIGKPQASATFAGAPATVEAVGRHDRWVLFADGVACEGWAWDGVRPYSCSVFACHVPA